MAPTLVESEGNVSLLAEGTFDPSGSGGKIYVAYEGRTIQLQGNTAWGYVPFATEADQNIGSFVVLWRYFDPKYMTCLQASTFDIVTGVASGGYTNSGRKVTFAESMTIPGEQFCWDNEQQFLSIFDQIASPVSQTAAQDLAGTPNTRDLFTLTGAPAFGAQAADRITNFNPKENDKLQIDLSTFDGAVGKLNIAKKTKQVAKLAKKDIDFIYDQQAGYLYYNENGKQPGFGDGGIFAILEGKPKVGLGNFEFR